MIKQLFCIHLTFICGCLIGDGPSVLISRIQKWINCGHCPLGLNCWRLEADTEKTVIVERGVLAVLQTQGRKSGTCGRDLGFRRAFSESLTPKPRFENGTSRSKSQRKQNSTVWEKVPAVPSCRSTEWWPRGPDTDSVAIGSVRIREQDEILPFKL